jgi:predicted nucleic acid-binding protein
MKSLVAVDTSVWVARTKGQLSPTQVTTLHDLLDDDRIALPSPVRIELSSSSPKKHVRELRSLLDGLHTAQAIDDDFAICEDWAIQAKLQGESHGFADLLIAAICVRSRLSLWTLDGDFKRIARHTALQLFDRKS